MDRITFGRKTPIGQRSRVDRFIASRDVSSVRKRRRRISFEENEEIWCNRYQKRKSYIKYLDDAFDLEAPECPDSGQCPERVRTWPCLPRARRCLASADNVLDLPSYSNAIFSELLDWSNDNILVAALDTKYYKWNCRSQSITSEGLARDGIQCCKFDPKGELLALGTRMRGVELHSNEHNKCVASTMCVCLPMRKFICTVTALDWSPTGKSLVMGCSFGMIASCTRNLQRIEAQQMIEEDAIYMARVSPDARYVAVTFFNTPHVELLTWPGLKPYSCVKSPSWVIRTLTWHPWRSALLGIGGISMDRRAQVSLVDVPTSKAQIFYVGCSESFLDRMLFNPRTGELVISLRHMELAFNELGTLSQLVVMSDPHTVVDAWGEGRKWNDRVRTMVFSPDGTKLATATNGEDLIIWSFLPADKEQKKRHCKRFSALPVHLDLTSYGYSVR